MDPYAPRDNRPPDQPPVWGALPAQDLPPSAPGPNDWTAPYEPVREPVLTPRRPSRVRTAGGLFGVALAAAVLASAGTYGLLGATGNLDRPLAAAAPSSTPLGEQTSARQSASPAATSPTNASATQPTSDVAAAAALVRPAVVTIDIAAAGGSGGNSGLPGQGGGSGSGVGSGIIVDANGWILTNRHVVSDGGSLTVTLADGREFPATVYGTDTLTDLAIVKIAATGLPVATLGTSASLQVGQTAIAIGDPLGNYPGSVTAGIVSGLNRAVQVQTESLSDLIQTDAAINPGNSGGALVDGAGHVIGVNTASSSSAQGIGFAIPIDLAKPLIQQALAGQKLARPWLGIRYVQLDPTLASQNKLSVSQGAWITSDATSGAAVQAGSPAEKAGLRQNDVITAVNGVAVDGSHPFIELMSSHAPGSTVTLTVQRGTSSLTLTLTLSTRPASVQ